MEDIYDEEQKAEHHNRFLGISPPDYLIKVHVVDINYVVGYSNIK